MERGLATLKPFGRFIELGKRDYVRQHAGWAAGRSGATLSLLRRRRGSSFCRTATRASEIFAEIMGLFESGELKPLP